MSMPVKIQNPDLPWDNRLVRNRSESKPAKAQQKWGLPLFPLFYCFRLDFYYNDYNYIHRSINQGGWSADIYTSYLSICLWFRHMQPTPIFCLVTTVHVLCFMARCDGCTALSTLGVNFFLYFLFSCFNSMSFNFEPNEKSPDTSAHVSIQGMSPVCFDPISIGLLEF